MSEGRPATLVAAMAELAPLCGYVTRNYFPPRGLDHQDLMQEARVGAWKAWRDFDPAGGASFRNFARLCIERQVITAIKTATRQKHMHMNQAVSLERPQGDSDEDRTIGDVALTAYADDPERRLLDKERLLHALEVLRWDLSTLEQRCFIALEVDGGSYDEVALALDLPVKAVDNAVQRARRKLDARVAQAATCDVCGDTIDSGTRCGGCDDEIDFARQFLAA